MLRSLRPSLRTLKNFSTQVKRSNVSKASKDKPSFTTVIGLEVHAQLQGPSSKLFSRAPGSIEARTLLPNEAVDNFDAALPGTYPMLNKASVEHAIRAALALGSKVQPVSVFERKHYYYYDLPAGYQITQQRMPLSVGGQLTLPTPTEKDKKGKKAQVSGSEAPPRVLRLNRIQLEQDSGKTILEDTRCLVDLNRAGVSLVEFVFEPDLHSAEEAGTAVRALIGLLRHIGVCDGSMEQGALRVDLNVSLVPNSYVNEEGISEEDRSVRVLSGNRVEVKNMNSVKNIVLAAQYEIDRQKIILSKGNRVDPETRGFDNKVKRTFFQRSKEDAYDYRFFPDPDLLPLSVESCEVERLAKTLPELPDQIVQRFLKQYDLTEYEASVLVAEPAAALFFEKVLSTPSSLSSNRAVVTPKQTASWITNNLFGALALREIAQSDFFIEAEKPNSCVSAEKFSELLSMLNADVINQTAAKKLLDVLIDATGLELMYLDDVSPLSSNDIAREHGEKDDSIEGKSLMDIIEENGWKQITSMDDLLSVAKEVIHEEKYAKDVNTWMDLKKQGQEDTETKGKNSPQNRMMKIEKFFFGAAMKACNGAASPDVLSKAINKALEDYSV